MGRTVRRHLSVLGWNMKQRFDSDGGLMFAVSIVMASIYILWALSR